MSEYQLPIVGALAVTAIGSLIAFYVEHPNDQAGKIQLPMHGEHEDSLLHDPFDMTRHEDVMDGDPINEEQLEQGMLSFPLTFLTLTHARLGMTWKIFACFLLAAIVVLQSISISWTWTIDNDQGYSKYVYALHVAYMFYSTLLARRTVYQNTVELHSMSIIHLAILTVMPTTLLFFVTILLSSHPVSIALAQNVPFLLWLHHTVLVLYFVAMLVIITIPLGPPLYFSPAKVYSEKMVLSTTNFNQNNVCGVVSVSVLDYLSFSYTTKVVILGHTSESLEMGTCLLYHLICTWHSNMPRWSTQCVLSSGVWSSGDQACLSAIEGEPPSNNGTCIDGDGFGLLVLHPTVVPAVGHALSQIGSWEKGPELGMVLHCGDVLRQCTIIFIWVSHVTYGLWMNIQALTKSMDSDWSIVVPCDNNHPSMDLHPAEHSFVWQDPCA